MPWPAARPPRPKRRCGNTSAADCGRCCPGWPAWTGGEMAGVIKNTRNHSSCDLSFPYLCGDKSIHRHRAACNFFWRPRTNIRCVFRAGMVEFDRIQNASKSANERHAQPPLPPCTPIAKILLMIITGYKPARIVLLAILLAVCETGRAQTSWAAASSANWNTTGSWSPAVVPGEGTNASIVNAGTFTVTYNSPMSAASIASLTLGSESVIPALAMLTQQSKVRAPF